MKMFRLFGDNRISTICLIATVLSVNPANLPFNNGGRFKAKITQMPINPRTGQITIPIKQQIVTAPVMNYLPRNLPNAISQKIHNPQIMLQRTMVQNAPINPYSNGYSNPQNINPQIPRYNGVLNGPVEIGNGRSPEVSIGSNLDESNMPKNDYNDYLNYLKNNDKNNKPDTLMKNINGNDNNYLNYLKNKDKNNKLDSPVNDINGNDNNEYLNYLNNKEKNDKPDSPVNNVDINDSNDYLNYLKNKEKNDKPDSPVNNVDINDSNDHSKNKKKNIKPDSPMNNNNDRPNKQKKNGKRDSPVNNDRTTKPNKKSKKKEKEKDLQSEINDLINNDSNSSDSKPEKKKSKPTKNHNNPSSESSSVDKKPKSKKIIRKPNLPDGSTKSTTENPKKEKKPEIKDPEISREPEKKPSEEFPDIETLETIRKIFNTIAPKPDYLKVHNNDIRHASVARNMYLDQRIDQSKKQQNRIQSEMDSLKTIYITLMNKLKELREERDDLKNKVESYRQGKNNNENIQRNLEDEIENNDGKIKMEELEIGRLERLINEENNKILILTDQQATFNNRLKEFVNEKAKIEQYKSVNENKLKSLGGLLERLERDNSEIQQRIGNMEKKLSDEVNDQNKYEIEKRDVEDGRHLQMFSNYN